MRTSADTYMLAIVLAIVTQASRFDKPARELNTALIQPHLQICRRLGGSRRTQAVQSRGFVGGEILAEHGGGAIGIGLEFLSGHLNPPTCLILDPEHPPSSRRIVPGC